MASRVTEEVHLTAVLSGEDIYGRLSIPGMKSLVTARGIRRVTSADLHFYHRAKNGVYDPMTFYHLLDALMQVEPGVLFRTADLLPYLTETKPQLVWDAITVGRVLNDMAMALTDAYGESPISVTRRWNGNCYLVERDRAYRVMLHRLLEDLRALCVEVTHEEKAGRFSQRIASPIERCTSVMDHLEASAG